LSKEGDLYTWGMNGFSERKYIGMLGQGMCEELKEPKIIENIMEHVEV